MSLQAYRESVVYDCAEVTYDPSLGAVHIEWTDSARGEDYRAVLATGLEFITEKQATNWFADIRELGNVHPADQEWTNEVWFPHVFSTSLTRMAVVQSQQRFRQTPRKKRTLEFGDELTHRYFDSRQDARAWLDA